MVDFYSSKVIENINLASKFHMIRLQLLDGAFSFESGQFITLKVGEGLLRSYSIASTPKTLPAWQMVVDVSPGGPGTAYIKDLKEGDIVQTTSPRGIFTLQDDGIKKIILGATGCGIASIKPMVEELLETGKKEVFLFWGLRFQEDQFFVEELEKLKKKHGNFHYQIVLSRPNGEWKGKNGHITEYIEEFLRSFGSKTAVYLCGGREMVDEVKNLCPKFNVPCDRIYFEKYF